MHSSRKLARFLRPYRRWAVLAPLMMALEVAMDLMQPRLVQRIIDQGIAHSDFGLVVRTGAWMVGLALIGTAGGVLCGIYATLAGQGFGTDLRRALFGKIQALSFGDLDTLDTGALITRLTNDVTQVQQLVMTLLRIMVRAPLMMVGSLIMAILTSPTLSLLFLVLIPVVLTALIVITSRTYPLFSQAQRRLDALNTVMQENLAGVRVVKAFARATHERERFQGANDRLTDQNIAAVRTSALTMPAMGLTLNLGVVAALWLGGVQVGAGELRVGQVIAFINYLMQTLMSLMFVSMLIIQVSRAEASAQRVQEVLDREPTVTSPPDALRPPAVRGRVAFEDVTFRYDPDERDPVLKNVRFVAEPGQTVALLGATGAGKSSLVNLVPRFYDVSGGRVTLDGTDVRQLDEGALRGHVGVALQESVLFSGTIRDNIKYGRPDATDEEMVAVARMAQAHDFISHLPGGYDSVVGQRGVNLSGGQRQRLAIARALLPRPAVLILDDSTSAVDMRTEAHIQEALADQQPGQTRLIVAQRISTVLNADKILVLEDGMIAGEGTHDELLRSSPIYREIYESQMESGVMTHGGE
ncbi:MAG: ABC transporter ATP-binding protein [Armatimonadetes bacterium]|nr:ABC transporter ATP-binding protein [Armatimonadota bacterium]